ncbi:MAG: hypothetical protein IT430_12660 [Phycisphaerales bacterium]|nr:hypothetical protein [Phycisphaerales bacterium]
MWHRFCNFIGGLLALARFATMGALGRHNRYWQWRRSTAFGDFEVPPREKRRALLDYGRWVHMMRRFR